MKQETLPGEVDVLIVGTGAAGLIGAITAARAGMKVLLVEKSPYWGGTSAMSGGAIWIPFNKHQLGVGIQDSYEDALNYLDAIIGEDGGPNSTPAHRRSFLSHGAKMVDMLDELGLKWAYREADTDYYCEAPGSRPGRSLNADAVSTDELGPAVKTMRPTMQFLPLVYDRRDFGALIMPFHSLGNFLKVAKIMMVSGWWMLRRKMPLAMGQALAARLMMIVQRLGILMTLATEVTDIAQDGGRISRVTVRQGGEERTIRVNRAVLIAAGGFARNEALRKQHQAVGGEYTLTNSDDEGDTHSIGDRLGARMALMDDAWWMPSVLLPDGKRSMLLWERAMPHSIVVDQSGRRFGNEAAPYHDFGRKMLDRNETVSAVPSWLIFDARHRRKYSFARVSAGYTPRSWLKSGFFTRARTLAELAAKCGIDPAGLDETVVRFNAFARAGHDPDFGRGGQKFDRYWGDPEHTPNPNLGTLEEGPFYAVRLYPGDIGTKGGFVISPHGEVLDSEGHAIQGLYACGNSTACVMGRTYPGAGGTIGPAMTFAYAAMRHLAGNN